MGEQWLGGKGLHCSVPTIKSSKFSREGKNKTRESTREGGRKGIEIRKGNCPPLTVQN